MRGILKGQFWMYQNTMMLPKLHATFVQHPIKALTVMAVTGSIAQGIRSLVSRDEDSIRDEMAYQMELQGSLNLPHPPKALDPITRRLAHRAWGTPWMPDVTGSLALDLDSQARDLMDRILSGELYMFQSPSRGDKTMVSTLEPFAAGWGDAASVLRMWNETKQSYRTNPARTALSWLGLRLATGSALVSNGIAELQRGDKDSKEKFLLAAKEASRLMPILHTLSPLSANTLRFLDITGTDGQGLVDWLRGIHGTAKQGPGEQLADALYSFSWTSRSILQPASLGREKSLIDSTLERMFPQIWEQPTPVQRDMALARRLVDAQIAQTMTDVYAEYNGWAHGTFTYGALLRQRLPEAMDRLLSQQSESADGILPGLRRDVEQAWEFRLGQESWANMVEAMSYTAERRLMRTGYFEEAMKRMARDPEGSALLQWMHEKAFSKRVSREDLADVAALIPMYDIPTDATRGVDLRVREIYERLQKEGFDVYNLRANPRKALFDLGQKPELSGKTNIVLKAIGGY